MPLSASAALRSEGRVAGLLGLGLRSWLVVALRCRCRRVCGFSLGSLVVRSDGRGCTGVVRRRRP